MSSVKAIWAFILLYYVHGRSWNFRRPVKTDCGADSEPDAKGNEGGAKPTLIISGLARDIADHSESSIATFRRLETHFDVRQIVVFENDSKDETLQLLQAWTLRLKLPVIVLHRDNFFLDAQRTVRLANARNVLLEQIRTLAPADYLLVMDLDGVNNDLEGVDTCLKLPNGWGGCCANQRNKYYDLWALRTYDGWMDCDVWYECNEKYDVKAFRHIPASMPPIAVQSCFGGAALYNFSAVIQSSAAYKGDRDHHPQCEHVKFHEQLRAKLYIQPAMLNTAPDEHIPNQFQVLIVRAKRLFEAKRFTEAEPFLSSALLINPNAFFLRKQLKIAKAQIRLANILQKNS